MDVRFCYEGFRPPKVRASFRLSGCFKDSIPHRDNFMPSTLTAPITAESAPPTAIPDSAAIHATQKSSFHRQRPPKIQQITMISAMCLWQAVRLKPHSHATVPFVKCAEGSGPPAVKLARGVAVLVDVKGFGKGSISRQDFIERTGILSSPASIDFRLGVYVRW
jgi:hypothetical protein